MSASAAFKALVGELRLSLSRSVRKYDPRHLSPSTRGSDVGVFAHYALKKNAITLPGLQQCFSVREEGLR